MGRPKQDLQSEDDQPPEKERSSLTPGECVGGSLRRLFGYKNGFLIKLLRVPLLT